MARAELVFDLAIILGTLINVFDQKPDRGAGGFAFEHARKDFDLIRFAALGGKARLTGFAFFEIILNIGLGQLKQGRHTINDTANGRAVAFAKGGEAEKCSKTVASHNRLSRIQIFKRQNGPPIRAARKIVSGPDQDFWTVMSGASACFMPTVW